MHPLYSSYYGKYVMCSLGEGGGILTPLIFLSNLLLFLRSEVILDVECLANLLRGFPYRMMSQ